MEYKFTIDLKPITKKNSQRIIKNSKTGRPKIIQSAAYMKYEKQCKTFQAQQNRSQIVGNPINQPDGAKLSMAELMKLKNKNPDMDITPYLNRKKEK